MEKIDRKAFKAFYGNARKVLKQFRHMRDAGPLNSCGYDRGGAYWGHRSRGQRLYSVKDGMGNIAFVDARDGKDAIERVKEL